MRADQRLDGAHVGADDFAKLAAIAVGVDGGHRADAGALRGTLKAVDVDLDKARVGVRAGKILHGRLDGLARAAPRREKVYNNLAKKVKKEIKQQRRRTRTERLPSTS